MSRPSGSRERFVVVNLNETEETAPSYPLELLGVAAPEQISCFSGDASRAGSASVGTVVE